MLRIALFSLISSSAPTAGSVWTRTFLRALRDSDWRDSELTLYLDDRELSLHRQESGRAVANTESLFEKVSCKHYLRAFDDHSQCPFDILIHNLENNPRCLFIKRSMQILPGIKCFYDIQLQELELGDYAHSTGGEDVDAALRRRFGSEAPRVGQYYVRDWNIQPFLQTHSFFEEEYRTPGVSAVLRKAHFQELSIRIPKESVFCLPSLPPVAVNSATSASSSKEKSPPECKLVIGMLSHPNGPLTASAINEMAVNLPGVRFLVLSDSHVDKTKHVDHGQAPNVTSISSQNLEECLEVIRLCDLFVVIEPDKRFSIPLPLVCALAAHVPCIVSEHFLGDFSSVDGMLSIRAGVGQLLELEKVVTRLLHQPDIVSALRNNFAANQASELNDWMSETIAALCEMKDIAKVRSEGFFSDVFHCKQKLLQEEVFTEQTSCKVAMLPLAREILSQSVKGLFPQYSRRDGNFRVGELNQA